MKINEEIILVYFSEEHLEKLHSFSLPAEQAQFTALPNELPKLTEGQYSIVILNKAKPVGFFLLHATKRVKEYATNPHAMLLTSLSINYEEQKKGYGKQGMLLLKEFVKSEFPKCDEIVLVVNSRNTGAQKLYIGTGFKDTGKRKVGHFGQQFVMSLSI